MRISSWKTAIRTFAGVGTLPSVVDDSLLWVSSGKCRPSDERKTKTIIAIHIFANVLVMSRKDEFQPYSKPRDRHKLRLLTYILYQFNTENVNFVARTYIKQELFWLYACVGRCNWCPYPTVGRRILRSSTGVSRPNDARKTKIAVYNTVILARDRRILAVFDASCMSQIMTTYN